MAFVNVCALLMGNFVWGRTLEAAGTSNLLHRKRARWCMCNMKNALKNTYEHFNVLYFNLRGIFSPSQVHQYHVLNPA